MGSDSMQVGRTPGTHVKGYLGLQRNGPMARRCSPVTRLCCSAALLLCWRQAAPGTSSCKVLRPAPRGSQHGLVWMRQHRLRAVLHRGLTCRVLRLARISGHDRLATLLLLRCPAELALRERAPSPATCPACKSRPRLVPRPTLYARHTLIPHGARHGVCLPWR
jgi:hypothetical protein